MYSAMQQPVSIQFISSIHQNYDGCHGYIFKILSKSDSALEQHGLGCIYAFRLKCNSKNVLISLSFEWKTNKSLINITWDWTDYFTQTSITISLLNEITVKLRTTGLSVC